MSTPRQASRGVMSDLLGTWQFVNRHGRLMNKSFTVTAVRGRGGSGGWVSLTNGDKKEVIGLPRLQAAIKDGLLVRGADKS